MFFHSEVTLRAEQCSSVGLHHGFPVTATSASCHRGALAMSACTSTLCSGMASSGPCAWKGSRARPVAEDGPSQHLQQLLDTRQWPLRHTRYTLTHTAALLTLSTFPWASRSCEGFLLLKHAVKQGIKQTQRVILRHGYHSAGRAMDVAISQLTTAMANI